MGRSGKTEHSRTVHLWDNLTRCNIHSTDIPEEKIEMFGVIISENFSKLMTHTKLQIKEAQGTSSRIYILHTHTHIYVYMYTYIYVKLHLGKPYSNYRKLKTVLK